MTKPLENHNADSTVMVEGQHQSHSTCSRRLTIPKECSMHGPNSLRSVFPVTSWFDVISWLGFCPIQLITPPELIKSRVKDR